MNASIVPLENTCQINKDKMLPLLFVTFRTSMVKLHDSILLVTSRKTLKKRWKMCSLDWLGKKKGLKYAHNTCDINMRLNSISFYTTTTPQKPNEKRKIKPRTEKSKIHALSILCILSQVTQKLKKKMRLTRDLCSLYSLNEIFLWICQWCLYLTPRFQHHFGRRIWGMPVGEGRSKLESDRCIQGLESITYEVKTFWYVMTYVRLSYFLLTWSVLRFRAHDRVS